MLFVHSVYRLHCYHQCNMDDYSPAPTSRPICRASIPISIISFSTAIALSMLSSWHPCSVAPGALAVVPQNPRVKSSFSAASIIGWSSAFVASISTNSAESGRNWHFSSPSHQIWEPVSDSSMGVSEMMSTGVTSGRLSELLSVEGASPRKVTESTPPVMQILFQIRSRFFYWRALMLFGHLLYLPGQSM